MTKKILAVSGGVDSVVMLDFLMHKYPAEDLIVAHFNHGLRNNADLDEEFTRQLAAQYGCEFVTERAQLANYSEALARSKRYEFLQKVARTHHAQICTAHHLDDLIESIAINLLRGTGWRGLAVLDNPAIYRPFLSTEEFYEPLDKNAVIEYAAKRGLHFREDQTNNSDIYLRNRVRAKLQDLNWDFEQKLVIYQLWQQQKVLKKQIDQLVQELLLAPDEPWQRSWFRDLDEKVALELLRAGTLRAGISATRPQLQDFLKAIQTFAPGKTFNLPGDYLIKLNKLDFNL